MNKTVDRAEAYYKALSEKKIDDLEKYLHPEVQFIGPLAESNGKEALLEATKRFAAFFKTLKIRSKFGSESQAMIVYEVDFPLPIGSLRSAALMTFQQELVTKIELFYDARPFEKKG